MKIKFTKIMKRFMCFALITGLIVSNYATAFAMKSEGNQQVDIELLAAGITIKQQFTNDLAMIGVDLDEILKLPVREDFQQAGISYLQDKKSKGIQTYNEESIPSSLEADRLAYAWKMAEWSQSVNPSVNDLEKESIYMYLSHYVDVTEPLAASNGIDLNSNMGNILAQYIVDYDRETYDRYLSRGAAKRSAEALKGTYDYIKSTKDTFSSAVKLAKDIRDVAAGDIYNIYQMLRDKDSGKKAYNAYIEAYKGGKSLDETVDMVKNQVEPKDGISAETIADAFVGLMLGVGTLGPAAVPLMMMNLYMELGLNLYDRANYLAMRMYYNFRLIERMDNKYGL